MVEELATTLSDLSPEQASQFLRRLPQTKVLNKNSVALHTPSVLRNLIGIVIPLLQYFFHVIIIHGRQLLEHRSLILNQLIHTQILLLRVQQVIYVDNSLLIATLCLLLFLSNLALLLPP